MTILDGGMACGIAQVLVLLFHFLSFTLRLLEKQSTIRSVSSIMDHILVVLQTQKTLQSVSNTHRRIDLLYGECNN